MKGQYSGGHGMHIVRVHVYPGPRNELLERMKKTARKKRKQRRRDFADAAVKHLALQEDEPL
jgi:hypothetical protein